VEGLEAMSPHYYSEQPSTTGKQVLIITEQFGQTFEFKSQSGIFNWKKVDKGSELLLHNIIFPTQSEASILDLGCGYGFLGIVIAKIRRDSRVILTDINQLAYQLTKENCHLNEVQNNT
jgi:16S rRNA (guanine1207-N2)-methyltransferase